MLYSLVAIWWVIFYRVRLKRKRGEKQYISIFGWLSLTGIIPIYSIHKWIWKIYMHNKKISFSIFIALYNLMSKLESKALVTQIYTVQWSFSLLRCALELRSPSKLYILYAIWNVNYKMTESINFISRSSKTFRFYILSF